MDPLLVEAKSPGSASFGQTWKKQVLLLFLPQALQMCFQPECFWSRASQSFLSFTWQQQSPLGSDRSVAQLAFLQCQLFLWGQTSWNINFLCPLGAKLLQPRGCSKEPCSPSSQRQCFLLEPFLPILLQFDDKEMNWRPKLLPVARAQPGIQRTQVIKLSVLLGQLSLLVYAQNIPPVFKSFLES